MGAPSVAVGATDGAPCDLFLHAGQRVPRPCQDGDVGVLRLRGEVVELKDDRVGFAAVDARMLAHVVQQPVPRLADHSDLPLPCFGQVVLAIAPVMIADAGSSAGHTASSASREGLLMLAGSATGAVSSAVHDGSVPSPTDNVAHVGQTRSDSSPVPDAREDVGRVYDFLVAHEAAGREAPEPCYFLAGAGAGERVELPHEAYRVLRHVIEAMRRNLAVTVAPQTQTLTTQQAADLLGVSRPTVIKLLDSGRIPFERAGTHRRILLADLLAYREVRRAEQYAALEAMSAELDEDEDEDVEAVLSQLRQARRSVAARRRAATQA